MNEDSNVSDVKIDVSRIVGEWVEGRVEEMRITCGPNQHDYWQGMGSPDLERLLYCRNCGDVITFALPRQEPAE